MVKIELKRQKRQKNENYGLKTKESCSESVWIDKKDKLQRMEKKSKN